MDLKEIKELIALMRRNDLSEFELETEEIRIKLKKGGDAVISHAYYPPAAAAPGAPPPAAAPAAAAAAPAGATPAAAPATGPLITSPMPGTFYLSPSPETSAFVEVGQEVNEETVVCILEAMKVMNEIKAETRGIIAEILIENGKPVGYGTPLFRLK